MIEQRIEYPKRGQEEQQIEEIVTFMVQHNQLIVYPVIFVQAWHEQKLRIFTRRDKGIITGIHIVSLIEDPVTGKIHPLTNYHAGADLSEFVHEALSVYE